LKADSLFAGTCDLLLSPSRLSFRVVTGYADNQEVRFFLFYSDGIEEARAL
jgi:hypothetical protein